MDRSRRSLIKLGVALFLCTIMLQTQGFAQQNKHEEPFIQGSFSLNQSTLYMEIPFELRLIFPVSFTPNSNLLKPSDFPSSDLEVLSGPTPSIGRGEQGQETLEYRYTLKAKRSGAIAIDSFAVRTQQQYSRIAPFYIEVESLARQNNEPKLLWQGLPARVFQGESFKAELLWVNIDEHWQLRYPPLVQSRGLILELITPYIQETYWNNRRALRLGSWLFFASSNGTSQLLPVAINYQNLQFSTPLIPIEIENLPSQGRPPFFQPNAVGDFTLELIYDPPNDEQMLNVRVQLSGEGSLHLIDLPALSYEGMQLLNKESLYRMQPGERGYYGIREESYALLINDYQDAQLFLPSFSWFNPHTREYQVSQERTINFISKQQPLRSSTTLLPIALNEPLGANADLCLGPYIVGIGLLIFAMLLVLWFYRPKKTKALKFFSWHWPVVALVFFYPINLTSQSNDILAAQYALEQQQWQEAINLLLPLLKTTKSCNKGVIAYNLATAYHHLEQSAEQRFYLLQGAHFAPLSPVIQQVIKQERLEQWQSNRQLEHNVFVVAYWLAWLLVLIFIFKIHRKELTQKQSVIYLLIVSTILLILLSVLHRPNAPVAVIKADVKALRVPDERATYSESLSSGQIYYVGGKGRGYIQLSDNDSKEGWVPEEYLWIVGENR